MLRHSQARRLALPLLATALALLVTLDAARAQDNETQPGKAAPVFKDGQAQAVAAFQDAKAWIQHDLWVETEFDSDGNGKKDRMHVDVTRPAQTKTEGLKVPVIFETSPYYSGIAGGKSFFWDAEHEVGAVPPKRKKAPQIRHQKSRTLISRSQIRRWVPRGFAVVHSASPGTGQSQGCPTVGGKNESLAPKAVIDWLCGRAKGYTTATGKKQVKAFWCTGKVGMTGTSYDGTLPLAAATTGVEGLECIIPIAPNTSYYHYYRSHGLVRHPGGYRGEDIDVLYDFINSGSPKRRGYCDSKVRDEAMTEGMDRVTGDYNEFWKSRNYREQLGKVKAAVLMAHGFNDWNVMPEHSVTVYEALKARGVPVQCYFHQRGHGGEPPDRMMNRWFTRYLYGVKNDVESDPKAWIVRERGRVPTPYADYPNPDAAPVRLHLGKGGETQGSLTTKPKAQQGSESLIDDVSISGSKLAAAKESSHRLLYVTPELTAPVHLSGTGRIKIRLASSKAAANLSVWIVSLPWTRTRRINDNLITRGWADPQNHESLTESSKLKKGKFYELEFTLQPDDQIIPAGQRIGLMIFSSDRDFTLWPRPGTELTVDLDATSLELPVVGGATAFGKAIQQDGK